MDYQGNHRSPASSRLMGINVIQPIFHHKKTSVVITGLLEGVLLPSNGKWFFSHLGGVLGSLDPRLNKSHSSVLFLYLDYFDPVYIRWTETHFLLQRLKGGTSLLTEIDQEGKKIKWERLSVQTWGVSKTAKENKLSLLICSSCT